MGIVILGRGSLLKRESVKLFCGHAGGTMKRAIFVGKNLADQFNAIFEGETVGKLHAEVAFTHNNTLHNKGQVQTPNFVRLCLAKQTQAK